MRYFLSVGEPSGDLHAANLIQQLQKLDPTASFAGYGGSKMQQAGCEVLFDLTQLGVMFFSGVFANFRLFMRLIGQADQIFAQQSFDAVILIDYPGFNWWIARKAKKHNIKVFYYGVPQMWAWGQWRISKIRKFVDYVICKLPFEPHWFAERGCEAHYVGHPYFDELQKQSDTVSDELSRRDDASKTLLLLPGSRRIELEKNLGTLIKVAEIVQKTQPATKIVMGCFNDEHREMAQRACHDTNAEIVIYTEQTLDLMKVSDACVACSGSVSLELLHHRLPTVIVYKMGPINMLLQAIFLRCKFITLPNLMNSDDIRKTTWLPTNPDATRDAVMMPEYVSMQDCSGKVADWIVKWFKDDELHAAKTQQLDRLATKYAVPGATARAGQFIFAKLKGDQSVSTIAA